MKQFILIACLSAALMSCGESESTTDETTNKMSDSAATTTPDNTMADAPAAPLDQATMEKNWKAYMTPGEHHTMMAKWNGTWTGKVTVWMAPGAPPEISDATAVNKMIYGGRYQHSSHKGTMMGKPFEGESVMAYDNAKKVFISTWIDNMGTGMAMMEGPWDEANKSITMTGQMVDPSAGTGKEVTTRQVMKIVDDNNHIFEMYYPGPDGKEFKMMEITMKRK